MPITPTTKSLDIKISTVVAVLAILHDGDLARLEGALRDLTNGDTDYFDNEIAVLDIGGLADPAALDWAGLIPLFKAWRLNPVAVRHAPAELHEALIALGLAIDVVAKPRGEAASVAAPAAVVVESILVEAALDPAPAAVAAPAAEPAPAPAPQSMIVDTPVRAGQRIYARGCDLILLASVNHGAEVIADGSIHVYAPLRGRALAGAGGNTAARIFATCMEPELVSIAGIYRTFDEGFPAGLAQQAVQVKLVGDRLDMLALSTK